MAPPFRDYDGRDTMRSLADALHKLGELGALSPGENVEIRTRKCRSATRPGVWLGDCCWTGTPGCTVGHPMPSAANFSARTPRGERLTLGIDLLHGATSDAEGSVELADGRFVHHVDLIPAPFMYQLTCQEELITRLAIKFLRRTADCYDL